MGTQSAVVLAEIILGFLEHKHNLSPPDWIRYIDDGLKVFRNSADQQNYMDVITSLNSMDNKIKWTTEPDEDICEFLDLKINQKSGSISTFHKKTASFGNYVPWKSSHATHQKLNIAFNLFYRAARINSDNISLQLEITRIERSLLSLGYPIKSIRDQKNKALSHQKMPSISKQKEIKTIFFTTTRNEVSTSKFFRIRFQRALDILSDSPFFKPDSVVIKTSFRQPPSINTQLIWTSLPCPHPAPCPCKQNACRTCKDLYTHNTWTSNSGFKLDIMRATCSTRHTIYILVDKQSNTVIYVGQTAQKLNQRLGQNRRTNNWHDDADYWILPIKAPLEKVKKIELEQILIQTLNPTKNKQINYHWWNHKSHYNHEDTNFTGQND